MSTQPSDIETAPPKLCKNCKQPLSEQGDYCAYCGQKEQPSKPPISSIFLEFFDAIYSLDTRFFRTIRDIWVPGRLTIRYFEGKRRSYVHPVRLFLLMGLLHFAVLGSRLAQSMEVAITKQQVAMAKSIYELEFHKRMDSIALMLRDTFTRPETAAALDTLKRRTKPEGNDDFGSIQLWEMKNKDGKVVKVPIRELMTMEYESLRSKYEIENFWDKIYLKQQVRFATNPNNLPRFIVGNLIWVVVILLVVMALVLKVLYIRQKRFLIEHLMILFHIHAFAFLFVSPSIFFIDTVPQVFLYSMIGVMIYIFLTMKFYYQQGMLKTLMKFFAFNFMYFLTLSTCFGLAVIVGFLLF